MTKDSHTLELDSNLLVLEDIYAALTSQKTSGPALPKGNSLEDKINKAKKDGKVLDVTNLDENGIGSKTTTVSDNSVKLRLSKKKKDLLYNVVFNPHRPEALDGVENLVNLLGFDDARADEVLDFVEQSLDVSPGSQQGDVRTPDSR